MAISTDDFFYSATIQKLALAVSMGQAPGYAAIDKFGAAFSITGDATHQDIWEQNTEYTFSLTADIDTLSSSSAADVGHLIKIYGIVDPDNDKDQTVGYAQLNGQNKVLIYDNAALTGDPISFWRVWRMENEENSTNYGGNGSLTGVVYCYVDGGITGGVPNDATTIRALIDDGNNQTLMAIYTIPPKKVGFLFRGEAGIEFNAPPVSVQTLRLQYQSRRYKKIFKVKKPVSFITTGTTIYTDNRSFPDIIPSLTDIKITKIVASAPMEAFATFDILLVDENKFSDEYLQAIGQPGY